MMDHNLLTEPIFTCRAPGGRRFKATLPGVLAILARGELSDFSRLRTHQLAPWCMFLIQLAAIALHRAKLTTLPTSEAEWRHLLLALTNGRAEPWCLLDEDLSQPTFLQPPVPEGTVATWSAAARPDDLDLLVTAKGHDVKRSRIRPDNLEAWVYALVTVQTMQGYPGRGYNGISRMKGGYGNRPFVGAASDQTLATRFRRDVALLLETWASLIDRGYRDDGIALTWLVPWDGRSSLGLPDLTPHFIEVCWRARLASHSGSLQCLYTTTQVRRCLSELDRGDVGDPWIPIARADSGALTVGKNGFHYRLLTSLLFESDYAAAAAQRLRPVDGDEPLFLASALARGQGKTEGLHQRVLPLTPEVRARLARDEDRESMGARATTRVERAATMRDKVLYPALKQLTSGGTRLPDGFDARVDAIFFDRLFATIGLPDDEASLAFDRDLYDAARVELDLAISRTPIASVRRFKAISAAESMFHGCLRKQFSDLTSLPNPLRENRHDHE